MGNNAKSKKEEALLYHSEGRPGKIEVIPTKPYSTQKDLSLAYSPGVAEPCLAIEDNPDDAYKYTAKGNLVAVISNGTAVLGLGDIGAMAGKPVMEGKGLLFKTFADIDVFDIEVDTKDTDQFIETVKNISVTFGGINLEDIKAPECFEIEERLKEELSIPVMHDDQHGTAIISSAALLNALEIAGKKIEEVQVVVNGAGAAAVSCAKLYIALGVKPKNVIMCDSKGVISTHRTDLNESKKFFATDRDIKTLTEAVVGADVFLGLSVANVLTQDMVRSMNTNPIVFALANPNPEISYEKAIHSRPDIIFATGRSDYPNQINNVLGFPYIFRGALDVQAQSINEEMKLAATYALAELTKEPVPENVKMAYNDPSIAFGRNYIIPKPLDTRLISRIAPAVAKAAIESGVARTGIEDWDAYRDQLEKRMGQDERLMRRMTRKAKTNPKRIVFAEGADIKTLMAVQEILSEKIAHPILIGNKTEIEALQKQYKLELPELTIFDPAKEIDKIDQYTQSYYGKRQRKGVILEQAKELMKNPNFIGLMMVESGEADGFISGIHSNYHDVLRAAKDIIGLRACCKYAVGMHIVTNKKGTYFLADTTVNSHPSADTLECVTVLTYEAVKQFNVEPVVALTSYSNFGEYRLGSPAQIQEAVDTLHRKYPEILVDGEMSASIAFNTELRQARFPFSPLADKDVNTIIFPNLSSGSIALGVLQELGNNEIIGPVLLGLNKPVHILQMGCSVRDIVYMTTLAVTDAQKEMPVDMCRI